MTRTGISFAVALLSLGCADHLAELGPDLLPSGISGTQNRGDPEPWITLDTVCKESASNGWVTACLFDSEAHNWDVGDQIPTMSVQPPYGFSFRFDAAIDLTDADLTTDGPEAAVKAYAAATRVNGCELPEDREENRVAVRVFANKERGLTALVDEALDEGTQVVFVLQYAALLRHHVPLPPGAPCASLEECSLSGYAARLYVGAEPADDDPPGDRNTVHGECN